jgi:L-threonylcarbamoyladenylate synthase
VHHEFLIDGGKLPGTPSTVVDLSTRTIIRAGAEVDAIARFLVNL